MKKYFLLLVLIITMLSACQARSPFDAVKQAKTDDAAIQAYIKEKGITAVKDSSGLYYQVIKPGTGAHPDANSIVTVNYKGELINGIVFDSALAYTNRLSGLVTGCVAGIPHIGTGGKILLLIPSALGYGNNDAGAIPANAVLIFHIDLVGFTNQ